jgi:transposase
MAAKSNINEFAVKLFKVHGDKISLTADAQYVNNRTHIQVQCQCSHVWGVRPYSLLRGGCPSCKAQKCRDSAGTKRAPRASESEKALARKLRAEGLSYQDIADQIGRSICTVYGWCNPLQAEKTNRRATNYYEANREYIAHQRRHYRKTEHGNAGHKRRKHARRGITEEWNEQENAFVTSYEPTPTGEDLERFNLISKQHQEWNAKGDGVEYWLEHLLPITQGGSATGWWNLSVTTKAENMSKGANIDPAHMALRRHKLLKMFNEN